MPPPTHATPKPLFTSPLPPLPFQILPVHPKRPPQHAKSYSGLKLASTTPKLGLLV